MPATQYALKLLQLDYDPRDGEVRGRIQLANFQPQADGSFFEIFIQLRNEVEAAALVLTPAGTQTMPYRGRREQHPDGDVTPLGGVGI